MVVVPSEMLDPEIKAALFTFPDTNAIVSRMMLPGVASPAEGMRVKLP